MQRRYPIGAELIGENQTHFRVWAPKAQEVDVVLEDAAEAKPKFSPLTAEPGGYFSGTIDVGVGMRYRLRVDADENCYPDPDSRSRQRLLEAGKACRQIGRAHRCTPRTSLSPIPPSPCQTKTLKHNTS